MSTNNSNTLVSILQNVLSYYQSENSDPKLNGYIGINTKCEYCKKKCGTHHHFLDNSNNGPYFNKADDGFMCPYCKDHPGEKHYHDVKK
jgi:hypothetical protein